MDKFRKHLLVIGLSLLAAISVILATAASTYAFYQNRVLPKTYLAGLSVGGQNLTTAHDQINQKVKQLQTVPLSLTFNNQTKELTPQDLEVTISTETADQNLSGYQGVWGWLNLSYWQKFLTKKNFVADYQVDTDVLRSRLEAEFAITSDAVDADLKYENGQLVVVPGKNGFSIDTMAVELALGQIASGQLPTAVTLESAEASPAITDEEVATVKNSVEQTVTPLHLKTDDKEFTVSTQDQLAWFDYTKADGQISHTLSETKIKDYLTKNIAKKGGDIKMIPKSIKSDTQEVVQEGKDGRAVQIPELAKLVARAVNDKQNTQTQPISIPVKTITFTNKIIYPSFVLGQWPGKYIDVNLGEQKLRIIDGANVIGEYAVSTGKWSTPTPTGVLYIRNKISFAYSKLFAVWMPWWLGLATNPDGSGYRAEGIHELPCYNRDCTVRDGINQLGKAVSHGCIRLSIADAKTVYDWAEIGIPVNIH